MQFSFMQFSFMQFSFRLFLLIVIIATTSYCEIQEKKDETINWTEDDRQSLLDGLESSRNYLLDELLSVDDEMWNAKVDTSTWSIAEIVEHLGLQQDMHFREVYVLSKAPAHPEFITETAGNEIQILNYESDTTKGNATWNVEPLGRWCSKEEAIAQFNISRNKFIEFISTTNANLKHHFTFRTLEDKSDYRNVRDLHQIVLTTITHTNRHIHQIEAIKIELKNPVAPE